MAPEHRHGPQDGQRKKRRSNVEFLPWAVQAKIKKQKVEQMMIKRAYYGEKRKRVGDAGSSEVKPWRKWGQKRADGEEMEGADDLALGPDRKPIAIARPRVERTRPKKERSKPLELQVEEEPSNAGPSRKEEDEASTQSTKTKGKDLESETSEPGKPRFRDLKRVAYSRESLHSFKSKSLKEKGSRASKQAPARHANGQPNMKLRMEVMLEQIKRRKS